ncbi:MAG: Cupin 2 conserved barrel domain protein [Gemmatimonadetes bacterium]|jgi:mannose-6-phosphate isomerase-like protein (cupin superfamily)|nr:Cupin 2 conserved barrel domain protein [Gemmatimonadota bacterium]
MPRDSDHATEAIMPSRSSASALAAAGACGIAALLLACGHLRSTPEPFADAGCGTPPTSRILAENAGERRVRRPPPNTTGFPGLAYTVKVDCESVGATDLFLSYEELAPGNRGIRAHHHPHMDEILIVRRGTGVVSLDSVETPVTDGGVVYIARNTVVAVRNTGTAPLSIAFIFPNSGYGTYLREWSVPAGQPVLPLTEAENAARLARARWLQIFDP